MQYAVLPIFLFLVCALGLAVGMLVVAGLFNPGRPGRVKRMPYESGMDPIHDTRRRFDVRFHLLAIAFLVFDVELLFLFPWAVASRPAGALVRLPQDYCRAADPPLAVSQALPTGINFRELALVGSAESGGRKAESGEPSTRPASSLGIDAAVRDGLVESRHLVFAGAMIFLTLLTLGFVYDWRMGVFRWR